MKLDKIDIAFRALTEFSDDEEIRNAARAAILDVLKGPDPRKITVFDMQLSVRCRNCLGDADIRTVHDILNTTPESLLKNRNFGETTLSELRNEMARMGFAW